MNGEHLEYSVQCLEGGLWICKATSEDLDYIEQAMDHLKKIHPGEKFRYAIRTVSDWCEMAERKELKMEHKCDVCKENEAKYSVGKGKKMFCRDCLVEEYGLCAICANDCKDDWMTVAACSNFEEKS